MMSLLFPDTRSYYYNYNIIGFPFNILKPIQIFCFFSNPLDEIDQTAKVTSISSQAHKNLAVKYIAHVENSYWTNSSSLV